MKRKPKTEIDPANVVAKGEEIIRRYNSHNEPWHPLNGPKARLFQWTARQRALKKILG